MKINFIGQELKKITLYVTTACNLNCGICYLGNSAKRNVKRIKKNLPLSLYKKLIDELAKYENSADLVLQLSGGEPFAHPEILTMLSHAQRRRIKIVIFTNGLLLDKNKILKILAAEPSEIMFSLDGNASGHDQNRGTGNFHKTIERIADLNAMKQKFKLSKPNITINTVINKSNLANFEKVIPIARAQHVRRLFFSLVQWADKNDIASYLKEFEARFGYTEKRIPMLEGLDHPFGSLTEAEIAKVIKKIGQIKRKINNTNDFSIYFFPDFSSLEMERWFSPQRFRVDRCASIFSQIRIDSSGLVTPGCSVPFYILGDLKKNKLDLILNSDKARKFAAEVKSRGYFGVCQRCCRRSPLSRTVKYFY